MRWRSGRFVGYAHVGNYRGPLKFYDTMTSARTYDFSDEVASDGYTDGIGLAAAKTIVGG